MITLFLLSLVVAAVVLVLAGWALGDGREAGAEPQFARITNGRDTDDALKSHRSR